MHPGGRGETPVDQCARLPGGKLNTPANIEYLGPRKDHNAIPRLHARVRAFQTGVQWDEGCQPIVIDHLQRHSTEIFPVNSPHMAETSLEPHIMFLRTVVCVKEYPNHLRRKHSFSILNCIKMLCSLYKHQNAYIEHGHPPHVGTNPPPPQCMWALAPVQYAISVTLTSSFSPMVLVIFSSRLTAHW